MKVLARLLLGTALVAAGLAGSATAAQAVPGNCTTQITGNPATGAWVSCASGTGGVSVVIDCGPAVGPVTMRIFGPWVGVGKVSAAICPAGTRLKANTYQLR